MTHARRALVAALALAWIWHYATPSQAQTIEPPDLADAVRTGQLPPLSERLPSVPYVDPLDRPWQESGRYGGRLRMLMARVRDLRQMVVYGYARLVGYTPDMTLAPDMLERIEVNDNREFTLHLRPNHKWSDGAPFTTEDFRYWWEDVANNKELSPSGPPVVLLVDGEPPKVEILSETAVRYSWSRPNPTFLHELARANPLYLYMPAHYLKQFHVAYAEPEELARKVSEARQRNWSALHSHLDGLYGNSNPDLPSLQPWTLKTRPPSERFIFERNPYFHRIDPEGRQLPYIGEVWVQIASNTIIPAKTGAGDSDLQARYVLFENYTFLKDAEKRGHIRVDLWRTAPGSRLAIYLNLNANDDAYRNLFRDVRFRRALSLATDRHEINQVVFFGLAREGNNTVLPESPLYRPEYESRWATFDLAKANQLLDEIGLTKRNSNGVRLLPDGQQLVIIIETAGESTEETDVLELVRDSWAKAGVRLFTKPLQRDVFRNRIYSGEAQASIWVGLENGLPMADMSPVALAPARQANLQWPRWGQYYETRGRAGTAPDLPAANELLELYKSWEGTSSEEKRTKIWQDMLEIHADQVFSIGLVASVPQPVVSNPRLRNLPAHGLYNWDPGAFFGIYHPDSFWFGSKPSP